LRGKREGRFIHIDNRGKDFSVPAVWTYWLDIDWTLRVPLPLIACKCLRTFI